MAMRKDRESKQRCAVASVSCADSGLRMRRRSVHRSSGRLKRAREETKWKRVHSEGHGAVGLLHTRAWRGARGVSLDVAGRAESMAALACRGGGRWPSPHRAARVQRGGDECQVLSKIRGQARGPREQEGRRCSPARKHPPVRARPTTSAQAAWSSLSKALPTQARGWIAYLFPRLAGGLLALRQRLPPRRVETHQEGQSHPAASQRRLEPLEPAHDQSS
eukprot:scaffold232167_cov30-Tisochrysis_lutea.AAC.4